MSDEHVCKAETVEPDPTCGCGRVVIVCSCGWRSKEVHRATMAFVVYAHRKARS